MVKLVAGQVAMLANQIYAGRRYLEVENELSVLVGCRQAQWLQSVPWPSPGKVQTASLKVPA